MLRKGWRSLDRLSGTYEQLIEHVPQLLLATQNCMITSVKYLLPQPAADVTAGRARAPCGRSRRRATEDDVPDGSLRDGGGRMKRALPAFGLVA